jgi:hypothetical protein
MGFFLGRNRSGCQSTHRYRLKFLALKLASGIAWAFTLA